jgi:hypothetical protein
MPILETSFAMPIIGAVFGHMSMGHAFARKK